MPRETYGRGISGFGRPAPNNTTRAEQHNPRRTGAVYPPAGFFPLPGAPAGAVALMRRLLTSPWKGCDVAASRSLPGPGGADNQARPGLVGNQAGGLALSHRLAVDQQGQRAVGLQRGLYLEAALAQRLRRGDGCHLRVFADGQAKFSLGQINRVAAGAAALGDDHPLGSGGFDIRGDFQGLLGDVRRRSGGTVSPDFQGPASRAAAGAASAAARPRFRAARPSPARSVLPPAGLSCPERR